jgi:hypothetical protein
MLIIEIMAKKNSLVKQEVTDIIYYENSVDVMIEGYGNFDMDVIYTNNKLLYINIEDLFKELKIACIVGQKGDSIGGFIENENQHYSINYIKKQIIVGSKLFDFQNGFITKMGLHFMESSLFSQTFGIHLTFNFRGLYVKLKSDFELPVLKEIRMSKIRSNMSEIKNEFKTDTVLPRNYHLFKFGTLDWTASSIQTWKTSIFNNIGFSLGTEFLYGETDVSFNYSDQYKFDNRQLYYLWQWVDNDNKIIKQAQTGRIYNQTISFINAPLIGAILRNSPTTIRKANGYYTINEYTEPDWTVELYINNVLIEYTKADASGLFLFKVPIVYGYTVLKLKFYGPLGEERTDERTMNVPYTIMPPNEFEYGLTFGILQDSLPNRFGKAEFNYGVNNYLTFGGGWEYLSSISNGSNIPYAKATLLPFSTLTLNAEYAHGVKTRGLLNYNFSNSAFLEIDYTKYIEGQLATIINANALENRKIRLSLPFRLDKITGFAKIDYSQLVYKTYSYNQQNIMFSVYYKQFSANSSSQINWINNLQTYITSDLTLSYRTENGFTLRPSVLYNVSESKVMTLKFDIEKRIEKAYFSFSYLKNIMFNDSYININFKYDLAFARTNLSTSYSEAYISTSENAQGSLAFGSGNNYIYTSNNSSVGKGGISIYPFLDMNNNGIFDNNEHFVKINAVRINNGQAIINDKDSIVRIPDLNPFTYYNLEFKDNDLENISWRFKLKTYQVMIDPNQFKRIDIPITPIGEVSGMIYMNENNILTGIGRISIDIYKKNSDKVIAVVLSESDGYFNYLGLEPGEYSACIDSDQMNKLKFNVSPIQMNFNIQLLEEGDIVEDIDFVLTKKKVIEQLKEK